MRIYRVYAQFLLSQTDIFLNKESSHHLANVLRCREGEICHVFDGVGNEVKTKIVQISKSQMRLQVLEVIHNQTESLLQLHLFQALCKGDKMDFIIQKSVELGVKAITPLLTERCDVKLSGDRLEKRMTHWQNIIINATEQSGRAVLPLLNAPLALQEAILQQADSLRLLFTPHTEKKLLEIGEGLVPTQQTVAVFVGPEGGFSERETSSAMTQGVEAIILGKRILRTETAPIAIMSSLQTLWGDFSG